MFGTNEVITPRAFADAPPRTLLTNSIFYTLQGEGPFSGQRAAFVRLSKCNLQCSFCDSNFDAGTQLQFGQIFDEIQRKIEKFKKHNSVAYKFDEYKDLLIVITGGEPMMQPNLSEFCEIARALGYRTQIESNGNFYLPLPQSTVLVLSPKVNERTGAHIKVHPRTVARANALKFVISATMPGYQTIPEFALQWRDAKPKERELYVSPMNCYLHSPQTVASFWSPGLFDLAALQRNYEHAARLAMQYDAILSLQTHVFASLP